MRNLFLSLVILLLFCQVGYATDYTQDANCQGAWLFTDTDYNGGSGTTVADASQNSNDLTLQQNAAWDTTNVSFNVSGSAANSVLLDGTDDYLDNSGTPKQSSDLTVLFFANTDQSSSSAAGMSSRSANAQGWGLKTEQWNNSGDVGVTWYAIADYTATDHATPTTWSFFSFVHDDTPSQLYVYLDGVSQQIAVGAIAAPSLDGVVLGAKHASGGLSDYMPGYITHAAIFDRTLSSVEINAIYDYGLEGAAAGGVVKTYNGLAWASVKTINGLAVASVKTINGVASQ